MSSEHLASAQTELKGDLGASWNILDGASANYTDLGIARRFGGSAAAYSLRDIGAMNGRVVKVRRDVDGQGTDPEVDFSASQVQSGALEDWVNGKLETTLPADVSTAAAAYSLRKVKDSYAEDAVRIRRTSDSTEVDVAFDSDDKVSSSSAVTNVAEQGGESGSTNATDLNGFLNEEHEITNTSSTWNNKSASGVQGTVNEASSTLIDFTVTQLQNSGGGSTDNMWLFKLENHNNVGIGKVRISLDCTHFDFQNGGTVIVQPFYDKNGDGSNAYSTEISITSTGSFSAEIEPLSFQTAQAFRLFHTDTEVGDRVRIENLKVESLKSSATVHTWYDQAGSNDATQTTAANQPVIAENGTLLTNSMGTPTLKFVGGGLSSSSYTSGDNLDANGLASSFTGEDKAISSFVVTSAFANDKNGVIYGFGDSSDDSAKVTSLFHSGGGMGIQLRDDADNAITDQTNVSYSSNEDLLFSFTRPNTTYDLNKNSVNLRNDIASDLGTTTLDRFSIGTLTRTSQALFLDGDITELIIYASDQSDNRFKIESNINNYYGLYTFQGDGFVETWYDQSGNGNDATQSSATSQPKIVDSGSLVTQDGKPALAFDGEVSTGDHFTITKPSQLSTDMSILTVINFIDPDGKDNIQDVFISQAGTRWWLYAQNTAAGYTIRSNSNTGTNAVVVGGQPINTQRLFTVIRNNSSDSAQMRINGSLEDNETSGMTLSITSDDFTLGRLGTGNRHAYVNAQEVIFFGRAIESDASELETDINNHYSIY